jgi:plastocyanin
MQSTAVPTPPSPPALSTVPARRARALALLAGLAASPWGMAATLTVSVADGAGKPLDNAVVYLEPVGARLPVTPAASVQIEQVKKQFNPRVVVVPVGTLVQFPNNDTVRHQVYSFSPIKTFELKLYAGVPVAPVLFDKPGTAVLGCNIHDQMSAWIHVVDTPLYAKTEGGKARIDKVPAGSYKLKSWHPGLGDALPVEQAVTIGAADTTASSVVPTTVALLP